MSTGVFKTSNQQTSPQKSAPVNTRSASGKEGASAPGASFFGAAISPSTTLPPPTGTPMAPSTSSENSSTQNALVCDTATGAGAYSYPISVSLSCSEASTITYCLQQGSCCLQQGSCCDPLASGVAYSGSIPIGAADGVFCLSYFGEGQGTGKVSVVEQKFFTINRTLPNLQPSITQTHLQTTQLPVFHSLVSTDFARPHFFMGEINFFDQNPGAGWLNLSCQGIVETGRTLPPPTPVNVFTPLDLSLINLGQQVQVPLMLSKLVYGENFITTYVENQTHALPLYSCATTRFTLKDFDVVFLEASHAAPGTNAMTEFSGGFVPYSFFEEDPQVNRGPAGAAVEENSGQKLLIGSFGMYFF